MADGIGLMSALLKHTLDQIGKRLGAKPSEVPARYRKIRVKGMLFRVSRFVAPRCCNVAVLQMNAMVMKLFAIIITPLGRKAPLVSIDVIQVPWKANYICEVYEFDGSNHSPSYEDIPCAGLNEVPVSGDLWFSHFLTFVRHFSKVIFQGKKEQYGHFITEFIDRTCRIYEEADYLGVPGDEARDRQIRQIKAYAHGLIEKGGVSTDAFKTAMSSEQLADFYDSVLFRAVELQKRQKNLLFTL